MPRRMVCRSQLDKFCLLVQSELHQTPKFAHFAGSEHQRNLFERENTDLPARITDFALCFLAGHRIQHLRELNRKAIFSTRILGCAGSSTQTLATRKTCKIIEMFYKYPELF